jgi:hypothetical protein
VVVEDRVASAFNKGWQLWQNDGALALASAVARFLDSRFAAASRRRAHAEIDAIAASDRPSVEKFTRIYSKRLWLRVNPAVNADKSLSGQGSTLESTAVFRYELECFLFQTNARRLLDIPCGDFNWMRFVKFPPDLEYVGGDIVPSLVAQLNKTYGAYEKTSQRVFRVFDLTKDSFDAADIWLCKDCIQHLSNKDILLALGNFCRSSIKYVLISNHTDVVENEDIPTGGFRHVDLTLPPFNLPAPLMKLSDTPIDGEPRYVGVWKREDLILHVPSGRTRSSLLRRRGSA